MDLGLNGKRAFVAGASRGLGYAAAHLLAQEGVRVAVNSRSAEACGIAARQITEATGIEALAFSGNVTQPGEPDRLIETAARELGGLDLLLTNSAGPPSGKFESFSEEDWRNAVDLVFLSHVHLIRAALPFLRQSSAPSVLTVTSYVAKQPIPNLVLSNSVRAATLGLTKSLALELGSEGIRINSILPGWTITERVSEIMAHRAKVNQSQIEAEFAKQTSEIPLQRMGTPEEFARAAVFLLSPAASFITGVMLLVDGGVTKSTF
ncbi:MAG TPA: SDR family oxidoreductase [Anaerolineales bacterium]|nr:SDR family oxidoreductase [Anaerolineales bacterium]